MWLLRIHCLGAFETRLGERVVTAFESQKVRALLAYLVCHRERSFSREQLAELLWPERPEGAARRNLRQAVYNLKTALTEGESHAPPVLSSHGELSFNPACNCLIDVEIFEEALHNRVFEDTIDPVSLARAVRLYRGEFLHDLALRDTPEFEQWQLSERERLRERALEALRYLIESYLIRGEFRLGINYTRRLLALDPLSETAHGYLMRLFALSGQRSRALAHYQELTALLQRELGVEPLAETRQLYESLLAENAPRPVRDEKAEPTGPLLPLVGREQPYRRLNDDWRQVLAGRLRLTLVTGEHGIGKTRLVKSFLDAAGAPRHATVLMGHCDNLVRLPYQPFGHLFSRLIAAREPRTEKALADASPAEIAALARLVPELSGPSQDPLAAPSSPALARRHLFDIVQRLLGSMVPATPTGQAVPLILFFDDLHWAGEETFLLLRSLLHRFADTPLWIVATWGPSDRDSRALFDHPDETVLAQMALERLDAAAMEEISNWLVGPEQATDLGRFLKERGQGLPMTIAECINLLWDAGVLDSHRAGRWRLLDAPEKIAFADLPTLIGERLRRLPASTRRLVSLVATAGRRCEMKRLPEAAEEHPTVVEVGLEILMKRWIIRHFADQWSTSSRERDIVMWARGVRGGSFEFSHKSTRRAIYEHIHPNRRRLIHRQIADALARSKADPETRCEQLAYHYAAAEVWERALPYIELAACKACDVQAEETATHYLDLGAEVLERLSERDGTSSWQESRQLFDRLRKQLDKL